MMNRKQIIIAILLFPIFIASCNYRFIVDKRDIIQNQAGYLVFRKGEVTFYPTNDTIDADFLSNKHKQEGYQLEYDTDWLGNLSTDYSKLRVAENASKFSIIPVEVTYYLSRMWRPISDKNEFSYKWNNNIHTLRFETADYRQILGISLVRYSDRKHWKDMPADTTKFVPPHWHPVE